MFSTLRGHLHALCSGVEVPATKDGNLKVCALTLITRHCGSTRCRHTLWLKSIQRTSPSTPTTARAQGPEPGAQMRNLATEGCLANFMNSPSQRAQEANHRACARPGMQESRSATLTFCCCGHAEFGVCQHSVIGPDLTLCAGSCGEGPEAVPSRSGHERPVDSFHGCTRRDTFASGHVVGCCC